MFNDKKNPFGQDSNLGPLISGRGAVDLWITETECRFEFNCDFFSLNVLLANRAQFIIAVVVLAFKVYARSVAVLDFRKLI